MRVWGNPGSTRDSCRRRQIRVWGNPGSTHDSCRRRQMRVWGNPGSTRDSCRRRQMRVWGNPGLTRDLQQLLFLSCVAWRTRQPGARFDGKPSDGNDRSASRQASRGASGAKQRVDSDLFVSGKRDYPPLCHQNLRRLHDHF